QIDPLDETAAALERMLTRRQSTETSRLLAATALDRVNEAVGEQHYDQAGRLVELAMIAARKSKDASLVKQALERTKGVAAARQLSDAKEQAEATLSGEPDDPAANLALGKYLCFARDDWLVGLPHLAKGGDTVLRGLAAESLTTAAEPNAQTALADRWWQAAEKAKGKDKPDLQAGAAHWYALAVSGLSGLAKVRVEQRLQAAGAPLSNTDHASAGGALPPAGNAAGRGRTPATIQLLLAPGVSIQFGLLAPGKFKMGAPVTQFGHRRGEEQHEVVISKPYYLAVTETTQAQWQAVMNNNPSAAQGDLSRPVESVSPKDTLGFIARLNQSELGVVYRFRLPTEAEWEYACRADSEATFYFGNEVGQLREYAWYADNSGGTPHPVATLKPNAWGFYDMLGNVWEWCADWYSVDYFLHSERADPRGPAEGEKHVNRGGHYAAPAGAQRCASRGYDEGRAAPYGFRLACDPVAGYRGPVLRRSIATSASGIAGTAGGAGGGKSAPAAGGHRPATFAQAQVERRVAEWVLSQGGRVQVVLPSAITAAPPEITATSGLPVEPFTLFGVGLELNKTLTDADLERLGELSDLKELKINGTPIGDAGLAHLAGLVHLRVLYLHSTKITNAGLKHLAGMHEMQRIYFSGARAVGDAGLTILEGMPELNSLSIADTSATDATLARISRLRLLHWLSISGCSITDEGMKSLGALNQLIILEALRCPITDAGVASLAGLPLLANVNLQDTAVTDRALESLAALPMLTSINVHNTRVTDAGVQRLQLAKPKCKVER
ncbi:MAG TPA: SUMF1/EgtB/PvdO family nonheme iron enzyme, partial [Pirellulales bacterium]